VHSSRGDGVLRLWQGTLAVARCSESLRLLQGYFFCSSLLPWQANLARAKGSAELVH